jgi:hypothetical protein
MVGDRGTARALSSEELIKLLEDDEEADTSVIRLEYDKNMQDLAKARLKLVHIKHNIPPPEKP